MRRLWIVSGLAVALAAVPLLAQHGGLGAGRQGMGMSGTHISGMCGAGRSRMAHSDLGHSGSMGIHSRSDSNVDRSQNNGMGKTGSAARQAPPLEANGEPDANGTNRGHESNEKH
jgi:hypothetical protein